MSLSRLLKVIVLIVTIFQVTHANAAVPSEPAPTQVTMKLPALSMDTPSW